MEGGKEEKRGRKGGEGREERERGREGTWHKRGIYTHWELRHQ